MDTHNSPVGLDAAGKTMVLYKLELGEVVTTVPTIGETIDNRDLALTLHKCIIKT